METSSGGRHQVAVSFAGATGAVEDDNIAGFESVAATSRGGDTSALQVPIGADMYRLTTAGARLQVDGSRAEAVEPAADASAGSSNGVAATIPATAIVAPAAINSPPSTAYSDCSSPPPVYDFLRVPKHWLRAGSPATTAAAIAFAAGGSLLPMADTLARARYTPSVRFSRRCALEVTRATNPGRGMGAGGGEVQRLAINSAARIVAVCRACGWLANVRSHSRAARNNACASRQCRQRAGTRFRLAEWWPAQCASAAGIPSGDRVLVRELRQTEAGTLTVVARAEALAVGTRILASLDEMTPPRPRRRRP